MIREFFARWNINDEAKNTPRLLYNWWGHLEQAGGEEVVVLAVELDLLDPAEAEEDGEQREQHDGGVRDVGEEDGQLRHVQLPVVDQHEEEDQTDQRRHQHQQPEEEALVIRNLHLVRENIFNALKYFYVKIYIWFFL